jgi:predicted DNA-binding protein with PD1-like motif
MRTFAFRLLPGEDLKKEIQSYLINQGIEAAVPLSVVGSLSQLNIRLAGAKTSFKQSGPREILALNGTLSQHGSHLHLMVSDEHGNCIGGHLLEDCIVNTTVELVLADLPELVFSRKPDARTGYRELDVQKKN